MAEGFKLLVFLLFLFPTVLLGWNETAEGFKEAIYKIIEKLSTFTERFSLGWLLGGSSGLHLGLILKRLLWGSSLVAWCKTGIMTLIVWCVCK